MNRDQKAAISIAKANMDEVIQEVRALVQALDEAGELDTAEYVAISTDLYAASQVTNRLEWIRKERPQGAEWRAFTGQGDTDDRV